MEDKEEIEVSRMLDEGCPQDPVGTATEEVERRCKYCRCRIKEGIICRECLMTDVIYG